MVLEADEVLVGFFLCINDFETLVIGKFDGLASFLLSGRRLSIRWVLQGGETNSFN